MTKQKRKRSNSSIQEQHEEEVQKKYSRLVTIATKQLRKECKIVKSFECQKIVRKIKSINENDNDNKVIKLQERLKLTKEFNLDSVVDVCLIRLGLILKQEQQQQEDEATNNDGTSTATTTTITTEHEALMESMLRHKRLTSILQSITEQQYEYNQWLHQREEWLLNRSKKSKQSNSSTNNTTSNVESHSLFINSLASVGQVNEEEDDEDDDFNNESIIKKKKNRMGQRARKAKALAMEAKKAGKSWDNSINWRTKKEETTKQTKVTKITASGLDSTKTISDITQMGSKWKENGMAHPSWAAKEKSCGIVKFTGKKIVFD